MHIFSSSVYNYMSGRFTVTDIIVDSEEVPDYDARDLIAKV